MEVLLKTKNEGKGKSGSTIFALLLILAGFLLIGDQLGLFPFKAREILFTWQSLLIVIGLIFISQRNGKLTGAIFLAVGIFFMLPKIYGMPVDYLKLFWPVLLVIVGLLILFRGFLGKGYGLTSSTMNGDSLEDVNIFGGNERVIENKNFKGGEIINIFGGGSYNLLQSDLSPGNNVIEVVMVFGGAKFIVPQHWNVKVEVAAVFGGFADKRVIPAGADRKSDKTLIIKGVAVFGGGEISNTEN